jgi:acyl-CoA synthetase (NDP forming)
MLTGVTIAGRAAGVGFNLLISAGNEAVNDVADYVDLLAEDPATKAIGLVIETIRRPEAFFAAVRKAITLGKPVVAVKLGRSERTQRMR